MDWPLQQLGVVGSPGRRDQFRLEIAVRTEGPREEFECLHDPEKVGTFARVYAGQLRQGNFTLPLAVKIQRDAAMRSEQAQSVAAKFDCERLAYRRLEHRYGRDAGVAHHHDFSSSDDVHAVSLPPSILCKYASHALEPVCPDCRTALIERPSAENEDRALICPTCANAKSYINHPSTKQLLIETVVRQSPACEGCRISTEECLRSAKFLNFFPARLLAFERLDLDLADFLKEFEQPELRKNRPAFWTNYQAAKATDKTAKLPEILAIFRAIVASVTKLHHAGVTHYDLKPNNICLSASDGRLKARLIDLGFADVTETHLAYLRQVQGLRQVESDYASPELERPVISLSQVRTQRDGESVRVAVQPIPIGVASAFDPLVIPGDRGCLSSPAGSWSGKIREVQTENHQLILKLDLGECPPFVATTPLRLEIYRSGGAAADLYSLGIILLELLTQETDIAGLRTALPGLLEAFLASPPQGPLTAGGLAEAFVRLPTAKTSLAPLFQRLRARFDQADRLVAEELFGIALRMIFRHSAPQLSCYLSSRLDGTTQALSRLASDLKHLEEILDGERVRLAYEKDQEKIRSSSKGFQLILKAMASQPASASAKNTIDKRLFRHVLRLAAAPEHAQAACRRLLEAYQGDTKTLIKHLTAFDRLQGQPSTLVRDTDFHSESLAEILSFVASRSASRHVVKKLAEKLTAAASLAAKNTAVPANPSGMLEWQHEANKLLNQCSLFDHSSWKIRQFVERVHEVFIRKLLRKSSKSKDDSVGFEIDWSEWHWNNFGDNDAEQAINYLQSESISYSEQIRTQLQANWSDAALKDKIERLPPSVRYSLRVSVYHRLYDLTDDYRNWQNSFLDALQRLNAFVTEFQRRILLPWRGAPERKWFGLLSTKKAKFQVPTDTAAWFLQTKPLTLLNQLEEWHLGPAVHVYAYLLYDQLPRANSQARH